MASHLSPNFHIVTPRLYISRILAPRDSQFIIDLYNSDLFLKHNGKTGIDTEEKASKHIEGWIASNFQKNGHGQYLISLRAADDGDALRVGQAPIGMVTLMRGDYAVPDIGFALLPAHTGKGYATEAGQRVLRFATDPTSAESAAEAEVPAPAAAPEPLPEGRGLGLAGIFGFTDPDNEHSKRVCRRLGLEYRGVYPLEVFGDKESAVFAMPGMGDVADYGIKGARVDKVKECQ